MRQKLNESTVTVDVKRHPISWRKVLTSKFRCLSSYHYNRHIVYTMSIGTVSARSTTALGLATKCLQLVIITKCNLLHIVKFGQ